MIIIVDGLDKVGKTTLVQGLSEKFPFMTLYRLEKCDIKANDFDNYDTEYWKTFAMTQAVEMATITKLARANINLDIIIDRFLATEWAYLEEGEDKDLDYIWQLDKILAKSAIPSMFIFLTASVNWIEGRLSGLEAKRMNKDRLRRYYRRFQEYYDRSVMKKIVIDVPGFDKTELLEFVFAWIDSQIYIDLDTGVARWGVTNK